ncbi:MAG: hypothetical protein ACYS1A_16145 [Planctomycetota bacterium]
MDHKQRYKKLRLLFGKLSKKHKEQAKKIDILCNDLIAAQRDFIKRLDVINFTANFYESIVGTTDLSSLLYTSARLIREQTADLNIAFFLRKQDNFELHLFESDQPIALEKQGLENCFTDELVDNICRSNKLCTLDCLFEMGLQGTPTVLNKISAATIPLGRSGTSLGFILIYRSSEHELTAGELNNISAITCGLSQAIESCQVLFHSAV